MRTAKKTGSGSKLKLSLSRLSKSPGMFSPLSAIALSARRHKELALSLLSGGRCREVSLTKATNNPELLALSSCTPEAFSDSYDVGELRDVPPHSALLLDSDVARPLQPHSRIRIALRAFGLRSKRIVSHRTERGWHYIVYLDSLLKSSQCIIRQRQIAEAFPETFDLAREEANCERLAASQDKEDAWINVLFKRKLK